MEFNIKKCSVIEFGKNGTRMKDHFMLGNDNLAKKTEEKDLGVIITDNLSPERHVNKITTETYNLLRNIRAAFSYFHEDMVRKLIVTLRHPRLEYAAVAWLPSLKKHKRKIERIQTAASKMAPSLSDMTYEKRLQRLNLTSLENRRERGDLIAV